MKILMLGDIVGKPAVDAVCARLPKTKQKLGADFCVINAENAAQNGVTPHICQRLVVAGADVITTGNHAFNRLDDFIEATDAGLPLIRPANYPPGTPGFGYILSECGNITIATINLVGRLFIDSFDCPFRIADSVLRTIGNQAQIVLVDFHAEVTGEKVAMGWYLDGRVSALVGTHTHVQTADEHIYPNGTGYISDLGMCGPIDSVLGVNKEIALGRILNRYAPKNQPGAGPVEMCGVLLDIDENTGKCVSIERVKEISE